MANIDDEKDFTSEQARRGAALIRWAEHRMPALALIKKDMAARRPLAGLRIAGSLHLTPETAALARCLQAGGAELALSGSNPLSTRDEICASLRADDGIAVFARYGENRETYYRHLESTVAIKPDLVLDDGADLIAYLTQRERAGVHSCRVGVEQTTTGVQRLRALESHGLLPFPVVALNDAPLKREFDNTYGTGQNTFDGILRATNILIAGKTVVVAGYGYVGRGIAERARGMGGNVIVTEIDAVRALHACYDGFRVMPMDAAAPLGDLFVTATGCKQVLARSHFARLKDGAIMANSGHFDVEVDVAELEQNAARKTEIRPNLVEYQLTHGTRVYLLAQGRLVGQCAAEASPADIMDLTFTLLALLVEWAAAQKSPPGLLMAPLEFTHRVAALKLAAMGIAHDRLTPAQQEYVASWELGT